MGSTWTSSKSGLIMAAFLTCLVSTAFPLVAAEPVSSACEIEYPPFSMVDESGRPTGFSVELMRAALEAMGRTVTFRTGPWEEVGELLKRGEIQALPLVGRTPERELLFDFTVPYMSLHGAIVVRRDVTDIADLEDLRGRSVAVMKGDNAEEFLRREERGVLIHTTTTFTEALRGLSEGTYDAVVIQRIVALRLIRENSLAGLKVIDKSIEGFEQDFCFAVREGDRETLALLNEGLAVVTADGTYRHLHSKWFAAMQLPANQAIVVGGDHNYPPFEFLDKDGQPAGYNVDLTRAIAREMGLDIEIRLGPWTMMRDALRDGTIDALQGMFYSSRRDLDFDYSQAHAVVHCVSIVRKGEGPPPASVEDLAGKKILVETGDIMNDFVIENGLEDNILLSDDPENALLRLAGGECDCVLLPRATALYLIEKNGWTGLETGGKPLLSPEYCFAVASGRKALLAQFSEGLGFIEKSGESRSIYNKWLGVYRDDYPSLRGALIRSAMVIAPLLAVLLAVFLWSWSLRRQVAARTRELRESSEQFRYIFEAANVGKSITSPSGGMNVNRAFADYLGYSQDELKDKTWQEITPEEDIELIESMIAPMLDGCVDSARFEKRYIRKDGSFVWADVSATIRLDPVGTPEYFVATIVDITQRRKAEDEQKRLHTQLVQAQKMESIGRLAGGIAHDYNNILSVIMGYTELALEKVTETEPLYNDLREILTAATRSRDITRQLLAFARKETIAPKVLDLNASIENMLRILRRLIGENVDLAWLPGKDLRSVNMDPSQLDQVLANLCVNARDAISDIGKITIESGNVTFDEEYCSQYDGSIAGDFVMLAVSDDGVGMDNQTLEKIFEPFFTTKAMGQGTGLGLSMVYGIVKQNEGFINVYSEPGKGTTYRIYLPASAGKVQEDKAKPLIPVTTGKGETILVVEDEPSILKLTERILDGLGYKVLSAETPAKAIEMSGRHTGEISLLITDVVMPEMNGRELAEKIKSGRPGIRCLYMSGYTANVIAHRGVLDEGFHFIQKPFSMADLAATVRRQIDEEPAI